MWIDFYIPGSQHSRRCASLIGVIWNIFGHYLLAMAKALIILAMTQAARDVLVLVFGLRRSRCYNSPQLKLFANLALFSSHHHDGIFYRVIIPFLGYLKYIDQTS